MAERLESGQLQIRSVGGVPMQQVNAPRVDYTIASREEARGSSAMAEILDRMGKSINLMAKEKRQEEGLRFAAENPPTLEQLQLAKEGIPGAIPGLGTISGDLTYFGQALKKARTLQVASAFEVEGMSALTQMLADVESGALTTEQVRQKIASISKGYTDSLAKVDPEAAIKFNATMATHGNTVLKTALEAEAKRTKAENTIKVRDNFNNIKRVLEKTVSLGEYTDPETGQKYSIDIMADTLRSGLRTQTLSLGDAVLAKEIMGDFEKELRDAKVNAVTRHILTNDTLMNDPQLGKKIMTGQLDKMSGVMIGLLNNDMESVAKINANVDIALNRRESLKKQKALDDKAADEKSWADLYPKYLRAVEANDQKTAMSLRGQITDIYRKGTGAIPDSLFGSMFEKKQGKGDGVLKLNIQQAIYENKITDFDQIKKFVGKGITAEDASSLFSLLNSTSKSEQKDSDRRLYRLAKLKQTSEGMFIFDEQSAEYKKYKALEARRAQIELDAVNDGKPITKARATEILEKEELNKAKTDEAKAARKQLDDFWSKQKWIGNTMITRQNLGALKEKAQKEKKTNEYNQIEKLLNQAEGQ